MSFTNEKMEGRPNCAKCGKPVSLDTAHATTLNEEGELIYWHEHCPEQDTQ